MFKKNEKLSIVIAGLIIGVIASILTLLGNPQNMGFCIACFIRDTAGGLGLHRAAAVQYIRPEVIGIVLGAFAAAFCTREFKARGGSAPLTRFVIGFFVMIGCLTFLGCPFRMIIRLAGGDLNALPGFAGFAAGILSGIFFLKRGFSLKRTYAQPALEGALFPAAQIALLVLLLAAPAFIFFTEAGGGPGAGHAPWFMSLAAGLIIGLLAQRTRLCMIGGIRDTVLFKETKLLLGFVAILVSCFITNLILTAATGTAYVKFGFAEQPVAHTDALWNALGMLLVGFGCTLLGGCPMRQLVLAGEGNADSAVTVLGLACGAAFAHNFGLAASAAGTTANGRIAVIIGIAVVAVIASVNTFGKNK